MLLPTSQLCAASLLRVAGEFLSAGAAALNRGGEKSGRQGREGFCWRMHVFSAWLENSSAGAQR